MRILPTSFEETSKLVLTLAATVSFLWGVWVYVETRRLEATKPFLERQLSLYSDATQAASIISTSDDEVELASSTQLFWRLYWGELALVENKDVELAMINFGSALKQGKEQRELQRLSIQLAHACRRSLDKSWGINAWSNPDYASEYSMK